jgi:hypothetical protein
VTRRSLAAIAGLLLAALVIGACQGASGARVRLENQTSVAVAVHVNDAWVGTHAPGTVAEFAIPGGADQYDIQARSPSGAVLVSTVGTAAMIESAQAGEMPIGEWADLPCGAIALSIGWSEEPLATGSPVPGGACP